MTLLAADLLGDPVIRRSAIFDGQNRLMLSRRWSDGPIALGIGCNPSNASGEREDPTTHWLNRWFMTNGFGGYDLMNLYPFVSSSPAECRRMVEGENNGRDPRVRYALLSNRMALAGEAKTAAQVFVCWGNIAWDDRWIESVVAEIQTGEKPWPHLWCWGKTTSGAPKHPLARGKHRMSADTPAILWRAAS